MGGKPCIKGRRISVEIVRDDLAAGGGDFAAVLAGYPDRTAEVSTAEDSTVEVPTAEDLTAAIACAAEYLRSDGVIAA